MHHFGEFLNSYERGAKRPCRGLLQGIWNSSTISRSFGANEGSKRIFRTRLIKVTMVRRPWRDEKGSGGPLENSKSRLQQQGLPLCAAAKIKYLHRLDLDFDKRGLGETGKDVINHSSNGYSGPKRMGTAYSFGTAFFFCAAAATVATVPNPLLLTFSTVWNI